WKLFGIESDRDGRIVESVFEQLDLPDRAMESLSGGQRQRVFIGRCLVQEPAAMLLDEPDTYLDLRHAVAVNEQVRSLAKEKSIGVLWTSHDLNAAAAFADRVVLLSEGAIVASGSADEVMRAELVSRVFGVEMERIEGGSGSPILIARPRGFSLRASLK
ncbi:MAG: ABC transporter ATP-binding protein, partial [Phycisphaerae bacterium]|nr:ABC transporter ATP-binding protein [Phycisphaerae bacterium]